MFVAASPRMDKNTTGNFERTLGEHRWLLDTFLIREFLGRSIMRKLFIPLAKLLGIYMLYLPLTYLAIIVYYLFSSFFSEQDVIRTTFLYTYVVHILSLLFALILLFKTEKSPTYCGCRTMILI